MTLISKQNVFWVFQQLWIIYIGECHMITLVITQATATLIVLALATLGDATQIGLFLFMSLCPRWPTQVQ